MAITILFGVLVACGTSTTPVGPATAGDAGTTEETGSGSPVLEEWPCEAVEGGEPDYLQRLGCLGDFEVLSSEPLDASIPGARSCKTVIDRMDNLNIYFQNSRKYAIHWEFATEHLSVPQGLPPVPSMSQFNTTEYYSPDRRFLLGAVTWYEEPGVWVYEISPYDTATADMMTQAYEIITEHAWFGAQLYFHPTSQAVEVEAANLPDHVRQISTDELFAGISYQPLNLGTSMGFLRFLSAEGLESGSLSFRDIVVLDHVPNDIGVVSGIITAQLQTPLSHINVLSQNRGTPNMALIGAFGDPILQGLQGKWVELTVGAFDWTIREVTQEEADAWWEGHQPQAVAVPAMDTSVTELTDIPDLLSFDEPPGPDDPPSKEAMTAALGAAIPAFGGKASHYAGFTYMGEDVPHPQAFAIPVHYYVQHMTEHGLYSVVETMMEDPDFQGDGGVRTQRLKELRDAIKAAPVDPAFLEAVITKMETDFPGVRMRFRSSTNAEDLDGFTGAGLYTSKSGDLSDPARPVQDAIRKVWASIWNYKAYDERAYRSIDHLAVGMAMLCHRSFPDEEANGVALTANIFDVTGLEPGFYINVQVGGESVVLPKAGVTTDQVIYHFSFPGQPIIFLSHSNLISDGETVLTNGQFYELGKALDRIHKFYMPTYGPSIDEPGSFYAMDVEFKFDGEPGEDPALFVKQARPHPGWGL